MNLNEKKTKEIKKRKKEKHKGKNMIYEKCTNFIV